MNVFKRETLLVLLALSVLILDFRSAWAANLDLTEARTAFKNKEFQKVIDELSPKLDIANREAFVLLSRAYTAVSNDVMAHKTLTVGLAKFKDDREMATDLGRVLFALNKEREAKAALKEVTTQHPKYEPAYLAMAEIYEKRKNRYELRLLYQDLIEKVGERPLYYDKLCGLAVTDGLYDIAFRYCQKAIQLTPRQPENYIFIAAAYKETGAADKAKAHYKKAADSFSKSERAQSSFAAFLDESKNYAQSFPYWKKATEADVESARAWTGYAHAALELQKFAEALMAYEKLCALDKDAEKTLRAAVSTLKTMNQTEWMDKFTELIPRCAALSGRRRL